MRLRILSSGSSGNATLLEVERTRILIDAGLSPRELALRLRAAGVEPESLDAILLTHEHGDHVRGVASFVRKWGVRVWTSAGTKAGADLSDEDLQGGGILAAGRAQVVAGLQVRPLALAHDAAEPLAFIIEAGRLAFGHATDFGHFSRSLIEGLRPCDALVLESNYDVDMLRAGPYPWPLKERIASPHGHISNAAVARFLTRDLGDACRTLVLAHLSETNNHPEVVRALAEPTLRAAGRSEIRLSIATRTGTDWIDLRAAAPQGEPSAQLNLF
ncbi:MAG: MBL fold metallo-hydrolase [Vicinamibacteria bacterium]|nr:MBL fold metallo-hydrolase [Vicinamibacteria bacterium]